MAEPAGAEQSLVVHQDALDAACEVASVSVDQLLWHGSAEVARAVALFGPGLVVLPLLGRVAGVDGRRCLAYEAHPRRAAKGGLLDRIDLETRFGQLDPARLLEELAAGRAGLDRRLKAMSNEELRDEVLAFQDWRAHATGRLKTLERRAAWAFLGLPAGSADQAALKRAFKRKALELHPDKGGDVERFQLLQEMKDLLVVPSPQELERLEKERKEKDPAKAKDDAKDKEGKDKKKGDDAAAEGDDSGLSSDDSWDADEELRKMFPKRGKRKKAPKEEEEETDLFGKDAEINRDKYEAARRKLHRTFVEMWERAGKVAAEVALHQPSPGAAGSAGAEAMRHLRKFVDRFANLEVAKLKENDPLKAERIFRRFLEQGSEILCAAGAVNPAATVSCVAMQVSYPLMERAPSEDLKRRCAGLLDAIQALPSVFESYVLPMEDQRALTRQHATGAPPVRVRLLVPDRDAAAATRAGRGHDLPGTREVPVELPGDSTVADLRAAALHVCGGTAAGAAPRLFCGGAFIGGDPSALLADLEPLRQGAPVQCLPSNAGPQLSFAPAGGAAREERSAAVAPPLLAALALAEAKLEGCSGEARPRRPLAEPPPAEAAEAAEAAEGRAGEGDAVGRGGAVADPEASTPQPAASAPAPQEAAPEVRDKVAQSEENEDPWFDDFFSKAKKAPAAAEAGGGEQATKAEVQPNAVEERARRQAQSQAAVDARLQAQRRAAEAKRKLDAERAAKRPPSQSEAKAAPPPTRRETETQAIVRQKEDVLEVGLVRGRACWDSNWEHPCAGDRRADGSAVFCHPCNDWVPVSPPYEHRDFERHCDKIGHYGWID